MILMDVNILVYAHREDTTDHPAYRDWVEDTINGGSAYGVSELVLSGFIRVVTHPKVFEHPTPLEVALDFVTQIRSQPQAVSVRPGLRHWTIVEQLLRANMPMGTSFQMPTTRPWQSNPVATGSQPTKDFYDSPAYAPAILSERPCKPMPRKSRFYLPNIPAHVIQRGHNRDLVFFDVQDYLEYLKILKRVAEACHCAIHAYVLMTNHIHLLLTLGAKLGKKALSEIATVAQPETILAWNRKFANQTVDPSERPKPVGRPRVDKEIEDWVLRMARENRSWGYDRIQGALNHLGYTISDQTVGNLLKAA